MSKPISTLADFIQAIAGLWYSTSSKNKYLFTPDINNTSKGIVSIIQFGAEQPIDLHINLSMTDNSIFIDVEGAQYKVSYYGNPLTELNIKMSDGNIIKLLKEPDH